MAWLRCFDAAARVRSFTQAAAELHLTQGAVSQQVRELEERLGVALFRRLPRQLVLTEDGEALSAVVSAAFDDLELALARLSDRRADGPLALSCYSSFALLWLMPRIGAFYRQHPEIELRVSAEFHSIEMKTLVSQGIDAAVRFDPGEYRNLEATPLLDEYLVPVASPEFVKAHPRLRSPEDLEGAMLLHDAIAWPGAAPDAEWRCWLSAVGAGVSGSVLGRRFNLSQLAVAAALDGQGVAMGRLALVLEHLESGRLTPLFGCVVKSPAVYNLVHVPRPHSRVGVLAQWLRRECESFRERRDRALPALASVLR